MLTCFIKRQQTGSNKKFSKTRDIWTSDDFNVQAVEALLDRHHGLKDYPDKGKLAMTYEVNRIQDFNTADFLYFKNFVRIAKAAEWRDRRRGPVHLNATREAFFYGNVEDGQIITTKVSADDGVTQTSHHSDDGRRIFLSLANCLPVQVAER
jgi:probable biosynthetic protein (TIGR04098 family)